MLDLLAGQLAALDAKLKAIEARLMAWHRQDQASQCLTTIPGVGPIGGVSVTLKVPDPKAFRSGRHFAAWIGITPRENSTGGKHRPGRISRQGDETLRRLLVLGATAVIKQAKPGRTAPWLLGLLARQPKKLAAVALANKMARIIWAMPASSGPCPHHLGHARIIWAMPASSGPCPHHLGHARIIWAMMVSGEVYRKPQQA